MPATNLYFNNFANVQEQTLLEDLIIESIKIYGIECYYMPRTLVAEDSLFGEDPLSKFEQAYNVEMYIKSVDGFEGEGDFLSKFNIEIRDEITFVVSRRRWSEEIGVEQSTPVNEDEGVARPAEGDLIYFPLNGKIFEVKFVEHEAVFYQLGELQTYELRCELYEYSYEEIDTGIASIDGVVAGFTGDAILFGIKAEDFNPKARGFVQMENGHRVANVVITESGNYDIPPDVTFSDPPASIRASVVPFIEDPTIGSLGLQITNEGRGYIDDPVLTIPAPPERFARFGDNSLQGSDTGRTASSGTEQNGKVEFWVYPTTLPDTDTANTESTHFHQMLIIANTCYGYFGNGDLGMIGTGDAGNTSPKHLVSNTGITAQILEDVWNTITLNIDGSEDSKTFTARINGVLVYNDTSNSSTWGSMNGDIRFGFQQTGFVSNTNINLGIFDGYLDDYHSTNIPDDFIGTVKTIKGVPKNSTLPGTTAYISFNNVQAAADLTLVNGSANTINITSAGEGYYSTVPNVTVPAPPEAATANGTAILFVGGGVDRVRINNPGSGYVTPPTVTFADEQLELPFFLLSEEGDYLILEEYQGANTAADANEFFQLEAEGKGNDRDTDFIDFSEFNPFSEKGNW